MPSTSRTPVAQVHFSKRMLAVLALLIIAPWFAVIYILSSRGVTAPTPAISIDSTAQASQVNASIASSAKPATANAQNSNNAGVLVPTTKPSIEITELHPGAWGRVEAVPIVLELPDEYVFVPPENFPAVKWTFTGSTRAQALEIFASSGFSPEQMTKIRSAKWTDSPASSTVEPGDELILSMSSEVREKLYEQLVKMPANATAIDPYWYRPGKVDQRLRGTDLSPDSIALLKRLLYPHGSNQLLFSDIEPVLRSIPDPIERQRFMKAVSRKRSLMARVVIDKNTDVNAMAEYWGTDGRQKDLLPLLKALKYNTGAEGATETSKLNILCLLPPFARERLYNHPVQKESTSGQKEDCFWSAFNFFNPDPDYRVNDLGYAAQLLQKDYYKIAAPSRLGDLILLGDPQGNAVHAASFIADDVVFTKNGENYTQPWILMRMEDMLDTYRIKTPNLQLLCYRKKNF